MIVLKHGNSSATILPEYGGVLSELILNGQFILTEVNQNIAQGEWPSGGMPLCFPFSGRVWNKGIQGKYLSGEIRESDHSMSREAQVFNMDIHGFGSRLPWTVLTATENEATLRLKDSPETRPNYPWGFEVLLTYKLTDAVLDVQLNIRCNEILHHADGNAMPVAPGFHPYFAARHPGAKLDGCFSFAYDHITLAALESIDVTNDATSTGNAGSKHLLTEASFDGVSGAARTPEGFYDLPAHSALLHNKIFTSLTGNSVSIGQIKMSWQPASQWQYLVFWAKPEKHFFCIEPWYGLPDAPHRAENTGGVARLQEQETRCFDLRLELARAKPAPAEGDATI